MSGPSDRFTASESWAYMPGSSAPSLLGIRISVSSVRVAGSSAPDDRETLPVNGRAGSSRSAIVASLPTRTAEA